MAKLEEVVIKADVSNIYCFFQTNIAGSEKYLIMKAVDGEFVDISLDEELEVIKGLVEAVATKEKL